MSGKRTLIIIGFVIVAAAVAVGGYYLLRNTGGQPEPTPIPEGAEPVVPPSEEEGMKKVVVAAQNIPRGTRIIAGDNAVKIMGLPEESVPENVLTTEAEAHGRLARLDIPIDMPITDDMLTEKGEDVIKMGSDVALQIPSGRVGYALPVARWSSVAWAIEPGDHVDVLISLLIVDIDEEFQTILPNQGACMSTGEEEGGGCQSGVLGRIESLATGDLVNVVPSEGQQRPRMVAQLTVQDAIVLGVGDWREEPPPPQPEGEEAEVEGETTPTPPLPKLDSLTLAVTPQDALVLKYAEEVGASMDLVLRSVDDAGDTIVTEQVTLDYLLERFNMAVPTKLPYGTTPPVRELRRGTAGELEGTSASEGQTEEPAE